MRKLRKDKEGRKRCNFIVAVKKTFNFAKHKRNETAGYSGI